MGKGGSANEVSSSPGGGFDSSKSNSSSKDPEVKEREGFGGKDPEGEQSEKEAEKPNKQEQSKQEQSKQEQGKSGPGFKTTAFALAAAVLAGPLIGLAVIGGAALLEHGKGQQQGQEQGQQKENNPPPGMSPEDAKAAKEVGRNANMTPRETASPGGDFSPGAQGQSARKTSELGGRGAA